MRKLMIGLLVSLLMIFAVVPAASAMDVREGVRNTVEKTEVIEDDVMLFGSTIMVDGTVNGDVFAFGDTVFVRGTINGNLITAASHIEVQGNVTGSVFSAGDQIFVGGRIDGSLLSAGSSIVLDTSSSVSHSVVAAADRIYHKGTVGRGMALGGNIIDIYGKVGKELRAGAHDLRINNGAVIDGPVTYGSDQKAYIDPGARTGEVKYSYTDVQWNAGGFWISRWWKVISFAAFLGFGLLLLALFPSLRRSFPQLVLEKPWQLPVTGIVTLVLFPLAVVLVMVTVIGIPLGAMAILSLPVLIYVGQVMVSFTIGKLLGDRVEAMANWGWPLLFLVGAVVTTGMRMVPWMGWMFGLAFVLYGFGGMLWTMFVRRTTAA